MGDFPEIAAIQSFIAYHKISVSPSMKEVVALQLTPLQLHLKGKTFHIQLSDEYHDLSLKSKLLKYVLVFRALESLQETNDYLDWCKKEGLNATNEKLRSYYQDIIGVLPQINAVFPDQHPTSFISDYDYQLNAGAMQYLRTMESS